MAEAPKKSPEQVLLEKKVADLKAQIPDLKPGSSIRVRKEAALKQVEGDLAAFALK